MSLKILILGLNYAPDFIGIPKYTTEQAEWLAERGHEVHVITAFPYYPAWKVPENYNRWLYSFEKEQNVNLIRCPFYVPTNPSGAKRIVHLASFGLSAIPAALYAAFTLKPDLVFTVAPALLSAPAAILAAKFGKSKSWLHIQDFEIEAAYAAGLLKKQRARDYAERFERALFKRFDKISTISPQMIARLSEKNIPQEKLYELRNWANTQAIQPLQQPSSLREEWQITEKNVALYSGNIANKQGAELIIEAAKALEYRSDLVFLICGDGPAKATLQSRAEGLHNVRFKPLQPMEKLNDLLGLATLHLLPQIAGAADLVLPSKLTNMLASGRPVIATADKGTGLAAEVEGCGIVTPPANTEAFVKAISTLCDDPALSAELGQKARARALERWSRDEILKRFETEAQNLVQHKTVEHHPVL